MFIAKRDEGFRVGLARAFANGTESQPGGVGDKSKCGGFQFHYSSLQHVPGLDEVGRHCLPLHLGLDWWAKTGESGTEKVKTREVGL